MHKDLEKVTTQRGTSVLMNFHILFVLLRVSLSSLSVWLPSRHRFVITSQVFPGISSSLLPMYSPVFFCLHIYWAFHRGLYIFIFYWIWNVLSQIHVLKHLVPTQRHCLGKTMEPLVHEAGLQRWSLGACIWGDSWVLLLILSSVSSPAAKTWTSFWHMFLLLEPFHHAFPTMMDRNPLKRWVKINFLSIAFLCWLFHDDSEKTANRILSSCLPKT